MRLSSEMMAVAGDAREEQGLGRRQLWFVAQPYTDDDCYDYTMAIAFNDAYANADADAADTFFDAHVYAAYSDADADDAFSDAVHRRGSYADADADATLLG